MMKRKAAAISVCLFFLALCACHGTASDNDMTVDGTPEVEHSTEAVTEKPEVSPAPEPSPAVSQQPSSEPAPTPEAAPEPSAAPQREELEDYFDNAVFVGDSIMEGVRQYVAKNRGKEPTLGGAQFLTSTLGVSVAELLQGEKEGAFYRYNGKNQPLLQILPQMGCTRIFLQLGLNDMAAENPVVEKSIEQYSQLIDVLRSAVPGAEIIVITNPPKVASTWLPSYTPNRNFNNQLISEYVDALIAMCDARGIPYVDAHAALQNENGALPDDHCRDGYVHLNDAGSKVVVDALYQFAAERIG